MAANLTSQMSIDDSNIRDDGNTDGGVDGGAGRHATETLWGGRKEHELQLARTDGDKVPMQSTERGNSGTIVDLSDSFLACINRSHCNIFMDDGMLSYMLSYLSPD